MSIYKVANMSPQSCENQSPDTCPHANQAADQAVKKVFAIMGVDVDKPESVAAFQEDLRFGRKLRRAADHGMLAMVGLITIGLGAAAWAGIVAQFQRNSGH